MTVWLLNNSHVLIMWLTTMIFMHHATERMNHKSQAVSDHGNSGVMSRTRANSIVTMLTSRLNRCGQKHLWPSLKHYPRICMKELNIGTKTDIWPMTSQVRSRSTTNPLACIISTVRNDKKSHLSLISSDWFMCQLIISYFWHDAVNFAAKL